MLNFLFGLLGIIIGIGCTIWVQFFLRKENFKKVIYKEKFVIYKELVSKLNNLSIALASRMEENFEFKRSVVKGKKLSCEIDSFSFAFSRGWHIISKDLLKPCMDIAIVAKSLTDESPEKSYINIRNDIVNVIDSMRKELGVDKLSNDIKNMFQRMH